MTEARKTSGHGSGSETSKYMTFKLANEEYGLEILKVRELIGMMEITRIPRARAYIRGVINLRGKVIPVVDLRAKFGLPVTAPTSQTVIIVVQLRTNEGELTMGILVDEVLEVRAIALSDIEPPPTLQNHIDTSFILGIGKAEKRVIFLLDIDRILSAQERAIVSETANEPMAPIGG